MNNFKSEVSLAVALFWGYFTPRTRTYISADYIIFLTDLLTLVVMNTLTSMYDSDGSKSQLVNA